MLAQLQIPVPPFKRLIEYEDIAEQHLIEANKIEVNTLKTSVTSNRPKFIHLAGITGSGKHKYAKKMISRQPFYVLVDFDAVMHSLDGFQRDCQTMGNMKASSKWQPIATNIGYHLLQSLMINKRNILFVHTGCDFRHISLITGAKMIGYSTEMHFIDSRLETATASIRKAKRQIPESRIIDQYYFLEELIPSYQKVVDQFEKVSSSSVDVFAFSQSPSKVGSGSLVTF